MLRKKSAHETAPKAAVPPAAKRKNTRPESSDHPKPTSTAYKIIMFGLMVIGLLWILVYYISGGWPIPVLDAWNILIGFVIVMVGFLMTTKWH